MKKTLINPTYVNKQGYNGLDLSHIVNFTSSVGHIQPISWDFLQPGDKIQLQTKLLTRTSPLLSSAFGQIEENVRFFFVPMSQLFKGFESTFNGIQDFSSDFYSKVISELKISDGVPSVSLDFFVSYLLGLQSQASGRAFFDACRLLEGLGYPVQMMLRYEMTNPLQSQSWRGHTVNILPILAYHKVFFDYFRDTDRIPNDPQYYNADSYIDLDNPIPNIRLSKYLTLHRCPVFKDCVNNLYVSPLFGEQGVNGDGNNTLIESVQNWLSHTIMYPSDNDTDSSEDFVNPKSVSVFGLDGIQSVAGLRAAFAANKLLEITRRAKKHYDAQILSHFGVKVPVGLDGECLEVMHKVSNLDIGTVISTAATENAALGEIGGKGYCSDVSDEVSFEAKTHGILIGVFYARPYFNYYQFGLDKKLLYTKVSHFPRLEYDNLGQQPKFAMNQFLENEPSRNSEVKGWEWRYAEVKDKPNLSLIGMSRTLKNWVINRNMLFGERYEDFYVTPSALNDILEIPYTDSWRAAGHLDVSTAEERADFADLENEAFGDTDPFINQLSISYQKSTKLSTYGIESI